MKEFFAKQVKRRRGFSLMEVLVAMSILSIIVLIVARIFQQTSLAWSVGLNRAASQSSTRAIVGALSRDLMMAVDPSSFLPMNEDGRTEATGAALEQTTVENNTLEFYILRVPSAMESSANKAERGLAFVRYSGLGGSTVRREEIPVAGDGSLDEGKKTSSSFDIGDEGQVMVEKVTLPNDDNADATSYGDAMGVEVVIRPATPDTVDDYEILVGSCGPDGRWGTDDDLRPWPEGEN